MSPRAAWRLERLGFVVYDYALGKVDWLAAGMPTVRANESEQRAIDVADRSPATCVPEHPVATIDSPLLVVNAEGIVLGRVGAGSHPPDAVAESVMEPGPATVRAHEPLVPLLERMEKRNVSEIIVTNPEGRLLGVVHRP